MGLGHVLPIWVPLIGWRDCCSLPRVIILVQIYGSCLLSNVWLSSPFFFFLGVLVAPPELPTTVLVRLFLYATAPS